MVSGKLYTAHKKCWRCGAEWDGPTFLEHHPDPMPGLCAGCLAKEEAEVEALKARGGRGVTESGVSYALTKPVRPPEDE